MRRRLTQQTAPVAKLADFGSLAEVSAWLDSHVNLEATAGEVKGLSLEPMASLLAALGEPQRDYPAVHITGTNGKGSVAAMVSALAQRWGFSVGTYTSPHVMRLNERMQYNAEPISDEDLAALFAHLRLVENHLVADGVVEMCSWFELVTAAALRWFADVAVDIAVVEVGKLGRYDATNVLASRVGVITNIGRDHTDGQPGWQQKVMEEKAGILHPNAVAVLGEMTPNLVDIAARQEPAGMLVAGDAFCLEQDAPAMGGRLIGVRTPRARYEDVYVSLFGEHQGQNAAVAIAAFEALVDQELDEAVLEVLGDLAVPARFEVVRRQPLVVIDGAHNPNAIAAVAHTLQAEFDVSGNTVWVMGMMRDKEPAAMLQAIINTGTSCDLLVCCAADWPRALPATDLAAVAEEVGLTSVVATSVPEAVECALQVATDTLGAVMITGSLYVAGAARRHLLGEDR
ncbi:MAG: Mur ligase family protein [bacterium]|nr:Mur ligase family protein [bacterium]